MQKNVLNQVLNMHSSGLIHNTLYLVTCLLWFLQLFVGECPCKLKLLYFILSAKMSVITYLNQKPVIIDLCNYVRTNRWYELGMQLDIDTVCLNDIQDANSSVEKRRAKMFEEWLRVNPEASVSQLIAALRKESVQENFIAYKIEKIYESRYNGI